MSNIFKLYPYFGPDVLILAYVLIEFLCFISTREVDLMGLGLSFAKTYCSVTNIYLFFMYWPGPG